MKSIQFRRSRPSALALALALLITMLAVYAACSGSGRKTAVETETAAAVPASAEIRMEGLKCFFAAEGSYADAQEARIAAAMCAKNGGAGLIRESGGRYFVIREAISDGKDLDGLEASAVGLTLKVEGSSGEIAALSEAAGFLYAQARETAGLAGMLERGDTDASTLLALLSVYRTQARNLLRTLNGMTESSAVRIADAAEACAGRLEDAIAAPDAGKFRLIHAAACADWISLLETLRSSA